MLLFGFEANVKVSIIQAYPHYSQYKYFSHISQVVGRFSRSHNSFLFIMESWLLWFLRSMY